MRAVLQRVREASVTVGGTLHARTGQGFLVLLAVAPDDGEHEIRWMIRKILGLRVFQDAAGRMNRSIGDIGGELLVVSQFTLYADTSRGNRPGFSGSASYSKAEEVFSSFISALRSTTALRVETGRFGEEMQVALVNDGPVTLILDTPEKSPGKTADRCNPKQEDET